MTALDSARDRAAAYAPQGMVKGVAQLTAYQAMSDAELFDVQEVRVVIPDFDKPGHPLRRVYCDRCHEGINDGREVVCHGETFCRACASQPYYDRVDAPVSFPIPLPLLPVKP